VGHQLRWRSTAPHMLATHRCCHCSHSMTPPSLIIATQPLLLQSSSVTVAQQSQSLLQRLSLNRIPAIIANAMIAVPLNNTPAFLQNDAIIERAAVIATHFCTD
jgi:hypothetical protein